MKKWIHASNDFFDEETKRILRNADTSDWSKMQTERVEDEINDAGGYDKYIAKEKKRVYSATDSGMYDDAFQELVDGGILDDDELFAAKSINWNDVTPEDAAMFIRSIYEDDVINLADIQAVSYFEGNLLTDRLGYDGGYTITWDNGSKDNYGFYAGKLDLYPVADAHMSACSFDFDLGDDYDEHYIDIAINNIFEAMDMDVAGTDYRSVEYPGGKVYSQCGIDFYWEDYYNEAEIEEALANMIEEEGGNFFGIDFYSLED